MPGGRPREDRRGESCYVNNRCEHPECLAAFAAAQRARNHARRYGPGKPCGPEWQQRVLADLSTTRSIRATATNLGTSWQAIQGASQSLPDTFGAEVERILSATAR